MQPSFMERFENIAELWKLFFFFLTFTFDIDTLYNRGSVTGCNAPPVFFANYGSGTLV